MFNFRSKKKALLGIFIVAILTMGQSCPSLQSGTGSGGGSQGGGSRSGGRYIVDLLKDLL